MHNINSKHSSYINLLDVPKWHNMMQQNKTKYFPHVNIIMIAHCAPNKINRTNQC